MRLFRGSTFFACLLSAAVCAQQPIDEVFGSDVLVIAGDDACHLLDIYVAITREQQIRGLMFVRELPETTGMLFVYSSEDYRSMWMKNTYIPLDMLFARSDGTVASIATHTVPRSLESISSSEPVAYVLELNAGTTERLSIGVGSRLIWQPSDR